MLLARYIVPNFSPPHGHQVYHVEQFLEGTLVSRELRIPIVANESYFKVAVCVDVLVDEVPVVVLAPPLGDLPLELEHLRVFL